MRVYVADVDFSKPMICALSDKQVSLIGVERAPDTRYLMDGTLLCTDAPEVPHFACCHAAHVRSMNSSHVIQIIHALTVRSEPG